MSEIAEETRPATPIARPRFQFRLKHGLWAMALFAASLALFGKFGVLVAIYVLLFWWGIFSDIRKQVQKELLQGESRQEKPGGDKPGDHRQGFTLAELIVVIFIILILIGLLLPAVDSPGPHVRGAGNLSHIAAALHTYHQQYGCLPPAYVCDATGKPMHSWRVSVLPQLGYDQLYQSYRFDEPWDGPNNTKLLEQIPQAFRIAWDRTDRGGMTTCHAVIGPDTAWPGSSPRSMNTIEDSPATTVLLVDCESRPIPWTAPHDLEYAEAVSVLSQPPEFPQGYWNRGFFSSTWSVRLALMAEWRFRPTLPLDCQVIEEVLSVSDGRPEAELDDWEWPPSPRVRVIHYANWASLVFFAVVALWPSLWVREARQAARVAFKANDSKENSVRDYQQT